MQIGTRVLYTLHAPEAQEINRRRTTGKAIAERISASEWPIGAQAHIGPDVKSGDEVLGFVVAMNEDGTPALRLLLNGTDEYWVSSASFENFTPLE